MPLVVLFSVPQTAQVPSPAPLADRPGVSVRVERRAERFDFHVENPSNFEPGPPVPHFFEQIYDSDNTWIFVTAHYRIAGGGASTEVGLTPRITTSGSDIDTFFQSSGEVITSGTRGAVRLRSFSVQQRIDMSTLRSWTLGVTVAYRRSDMDFLPSDRIVTRSLPASETREPVGGDETTWSHVLESGVTATAPLVSGARWQVTAGLEALPLTRARLTISLPLKYPGELIRQDTFSFGARGRLAVARRTNRADLGVALTAGGAWGYRSTTHYHAQHLGGEVFVRLPPR